MMRFRPSLKTVSDPTTNTNNDNHKTFKRHHWRRIKSWRGIKSFSVLFLLFLFTERLGGFGSSITSLQTTRTKTTPTIIPLESTNHIDAIVVIAMGSFRSHLLTSSLQKIGGWTTPKLIYVLTDNVQAETIPTQRRNNTTTATAPSNVQVIDVRHHRPKELHPYTWIKWLKTQIFILIEEHHQKNNNKTTTTPHSNINNIVYLDADIVTETSLEQFLLDIKPMATNEHCEACLFMERWHVRRKRDVAGEKNTFNSGLMVLNQQRSKLLLQEWSRQLLSHPKAKRDQPLLMKAVEQRQQQQQGHNTTTRNRKKTPNVVVCPLRNRHRHIYYPVDMVDRIYVQFFLRMWSFVRPSIPHVPTFRHFTSSKDITQTAKII